MDGPSGTAQYAAMKPSIIGGTTPLLTQAMTIPTLPQWSPPMTGGMTDFWGNTEQLLMRPQWSPPIIGGMTCDAVGGFSGGAVVAMEPRR